MSNRREFLKSVSAMVVMPVLARSTAKNVATSTRRSGTTVSVRDFGARGDGATDDTAAINRAVQSRPGATVIVPNGVYLVNPLQSINPTDGITLQLSDRAVLRAIPVTDSHSAVITIRASRVKITGGTIIGERDAHLGKGGEWGMGIHLRGAVDPIIENVTIQDCWGDGIYIGAGANRECRNVTVRNCRLRNNRRQGLSGVACVGALITGCEFSGTHGTAPASGVDLEPNGGMVVTNVTIAKCIATRNAGYGMVLSGASVSNVTLQGNRCTENGRNGIALYRATGCSVTGNVAENNSREGVLLFGHASRNTVANNTIRDNSRRAPLVWSNLTVNDGASDNVIQGNYFTGGSIGELLGPQNDILIARGSCANNRVSGNHVRQRKLGIGGIVDRGSGTILNDPIS